MLYIHKLSNLSPRTADVESVYLVRDMKQKTPYPLQENHVNDYLLEFAVSDTDRATMIQAVPLIEPTIEMIRNLLLERNALHEPVNLQRAIQILEELPTVLMNNITYVEEISEWQNKCITEIVPLLNSIPKLRTKEQKIACDQQLNVMFQRILRNKDFGFNFLDIINEAHVAHLAGLSDGMQKGYFFHFSLEEELKKLGFQDIKRRIPPDKFAEVEQIAQNISHIKRGVERAYQVNMRMVNLALVLYAYVRWMMSEGPR